MRGKKKVITDEARDKYNKLWPKKRVYGYKVTRAVRLNDSESWFYELEHVKTGARHIHVSCDDDNNVFSVIFKTVPKDSTGVAHILEHSVLCGSKNYPVRDPFFSMLRRSLNSFMNAFTSSDWTAYPFATVNRKDYFNLLDVYLDAVFFPKIAERDPVSGAFTEHAELSFRQEAHHLEFEKDEAGKETGRLINGGVVYNEMKGAMSSPGKIMERRLFECLCSETTYAHNSGGEPTEILKLTHEALAEFYARHYHPSNAYFFTYGNLSLREILRSIDKKILRNYNRLDPQTEVTIQPRWQNPWVTRFFYPLSAHEDPARKYQSAVAWLTADIRDTHEVIALELLEQILLGNDAAPLRRALTESGLGTSLCDAAGYHTGNRDTAFVCGLKDTGAEAANRVEEIVFRVLNDLAENGIDPEAVEAALRRMELNLKEKSHNSYPYGLKFLFTFLGCWLHGGDPIGVFRAYNDFFNLRQDIIHGSLLTDTIRRYFLANPHWLNFTLVPDREMQARADEQERSRLAAIRGKIFNHEEAAIKAQSLALKKFQETAGDDSCLPILKLSEIPSGIKNVTGRKISESITLYQQPCSGITYFSGVAGAGAIPEELRPLAPFSCYVATQMGTRDRDHTALTRLIGKFFGSLWFAPHASPLYNSGHSCLPLIFIKGKCLVRYQSEAFAILKELIERFYFSDCACLDNLMRRYKSGLRSAITDNGHGLAVSLSARNFSPALALNCAWGTISQCGLIDKLIRERGSIIVAQEITSLFASIYAANNMKFALIGEEPDGSLAEVKKIIAGLKEIPEGMPALSVQPEVKSVREGWQTATAVSFSAQTWPVVRFGHKDAPALSVLARIMSRLLHEEIREKGGAYGGFALYDQANGVFSLASYRDPHILRTLDAYDRSCRNIRAGNISSEEVTEAILRICAKIDEPETPASAAQSAFIRDLIGLSVATRQKFKADLLGLKKAAVSAAAKKYFSEEALSRRSTVVISSEEKLDEANRKLGPDKLKIHQI